MGYEPDRHHRHSIRLPDYDYRQDGVYAVTLCTWQRCCLFGDVIDGTMRLNEFGAVAAEAWQWLAQQYEYVRLDEWVVMPNHLHGLIVITEASPTGTPAPDARRGGSRTAPTALGRRKPLGRLIGAFKTVSTKRINELRQTPALPVWQRNYYERVVRNEQELSRIRAYIAANPARWADDEDNPGRLDQREWGGSRTAPTSTMPASVNPIGRSTGTVIPEKRRGLGYGG